MLVIRCDRVHGRRDTSRDPSERGWLAGRGEPTGARAERLIELAEITSAFASDCGSDEVDVVRVELASDEPQLLRQAVEQVLACVRAVLLELGWLQECGGRFLRALGTREMLSIQVLACGSIIRASSSRSS